MIMVETLLKRMIYFVGTISYINKVCIRKVLIILKYARKSRVSEFPIIKHLRYQIIISPV